jgi:hypothetical protein
MPVSSLAVWRLGKPQDIKPTLQGLNTYTLEPLQASANSHKQIKVREFAKAIRHKKAPEIAQITIYESKSKEIKGYSTIHKGVIQTPSPYITLISRGYALLENPKNGLPRQGGGLVDSYLRLRNNIICTPAVTFDLPDERKTFNFCQKLDQECINVVYQEIRKKNPHAKIIMAGDCRGALNVLKFATLNPENVDVLVLFSPFISARELTHTASHTYLKQYLGKESCGLLHNFFQWWFPNYDPAQDNLMDTIEKIQGKKILIVHRAGDALISDKSVLNLVKGLQINNEVHFSVIHDTSAKHSRLAHLPRCQELVNAFFAYHGIPHNIELAHRGKELLYDAKIMNS